MKDELSSMRENYMKGSIDIASLHENPLVQFLQWFDEAKVSSVAEANAMILSTASLDGVPSSRTVLLKAIDEGFVFYTNYTSDKAKELESNPRAALIFLWKEIERQVRISGRVEKLSAEASAAYFRKRPRGSKLGAWVSNQSSVIADRSVLEAEQERLEALYPEGTDIPCPPHWGGYRLIPSELEFWQGRPSRLHDRIRYTLKGEVFVKERLAP